MIKFRFGQTSMIFSKSATVAVEKWIPNRVIVLSGWLGSWRTRDQYSWRKGIFLKESASSWAEVDKSACESAGRLPKRGPNLNTFSSLIPVNSCIKTGSAKLALNNGSCDFCRNRQMQFSQSWRELVDQPCQRWQTGMAGSDFAKSIHNLQFADGFWQEMHRQAMQKVSQKPQNNVS